MKNFKHFLFEEYQALFLVEAKIDDFTNQWMKLHADHPLVKEDPKKAAELIRGSFGLGQTPDEHRYITTQFLNRILKPKEDDPTIRDTLGMWRKIVKRNLHGGKKLSDFNHDSAQRFFNQFPELRKTIKKSAATRDLEPYHIGQIDHPEYGKLDVFHISQDNVKSPKEYEIFQRAMKTSCTIPGSTVCVQHHPEYVEGYSKGHGFFAYLDKTGTFRLGHGFQDRGIVRHDNEVLYGDEHKLVAEQTAKLIKNAGHKLVYKMAVDIPSLEITDEEIKNNITNTYVLNQALSTEETRLKFITPDVFKTVLTSPDVTTHKKIKVLGAGFYNSDEHKKLLEDPEILDKLIEQGQSHILFSSHPDIGSHTDYNFLHQDIRYNTKLRKPEDYKERVIDKFIEWTPKENEKLVGNLVHDDDGDFVTTPTHRREEDLQALLADHDIERRINSFDMDDFKKIFYHPNFDLHHGKTLTRLLYHLQNAGKLNLHGPHLEDMFNSNATHVHSFLVDHANSSGGKWINSYLTPDRVRHMIDVAKLSNERLTTNPNREDTLDYHIARNLMETPQAQKDMMARFETQETPPTEPDTREHNDIISAIIKSKSNKAIHGMLQSQAGSHFLHASGVMLKTHLLSSSEIDELVNSSDEKLMAQAAKSRNLSPTGRHTLLTSSPYVIGAAVKSIPNLQPEELEKAWDSLKKQKEENAKKRQIPLPLYHFDEADNILVQMLTPPSETLGQGHGTSTGITKRMKIEGLEDDNPQIVRAALGHAESPERVDKIIEKFKLPDLRNVPMPPHTDYSDENYQKERDKHRYHSELLSKIIWHVSNKNSPHILPRHLEHIVNVNGLDTLNGSLVQEIFHPKQELSEEFLEKSYRDPGIYHTDVVRSAVLGHPNTSHEVIDQALEESRTIGEKGIKTQEPFDNKTIQDVFDYRLSRIITNQTLTPKHLDEIIDQVVKFHPQTIRPRTNTSKPVTDTLLRLAGHKNLTVEHLKKITDSFNPFDERNTGSQISLPNSFYENILKNKDLLHKMDYDTFKSMTAAHRFPRAGSSQEMMRAHDAISENPNITSEHISEMLKETSQHPEVQLHLLTHINATPEHVSQLIQQHAENLKANDDYDAYRRDDESPQEFFKFLIRNNGEVISQKVIRTPDGITKIGGETFKRTYIPSEKLPRLKNLVTGEHVSTLLKLNPEIFGPALAASKNANEEQTETLLKMYEDATEKLKTHIKENPTNERRLYSSVGGRIGLNMAENENLDQKTIDRIHKSALVEHESGLVLQTTLKHPNLSPELMEPYLSHPNNNILRTAIISSLNKKVKTPEELGEHIHDYLRRDDVNSFQKLRLLRDLHESRYYGNYEGQLVKPSHYETLSSSVPAEHFINFRDYTTQSKDYAMSPDFTPDFMKEIQENPNIHPEIKKGFDEMQKVINKNTQKAQEL